MKRFKNILVFVHDDHLDKPLIARAMSLAERNNSELKVVGIIDEPPRGFNEIFEKKLDINLQRLLCDHQEDLLARLLDRYSDSPISVNRETLTGRAFVTLCKEVIRNKHDLLMITNNTHKDGQPSNFGSLAMHLLRKCPCPVWVFHSQSNPDFRRILVAVDIGAIDEAEQSLNRKLLQLGTSLAECDSADLHVLYCWSIYGERLLRSPRAGLKEGDFDEIIGAARAAVEAKLEDFLNEQDLQLPRSNLHILKGDVGVNAAEVARSQNIDLFIMGTLGRSGVQGYLIGNTAEKIIHNINCSLLAIKPDYFTSPIEI